MCGRFGQGSEKAVVEAQFEAQVRQALTPRYNLAPTSEILVIKATPEGRQGLLHRWGLIPAWAKDTSLGAKLSNARAETVQEKPSFRAAFKSRRCLIPADGFFEWQAQEGRRKQPFYIHAVNGDLLAFAGLWEAWKGPEGVVHSCTILTTEPNALMAPIHTRMPVILPPEAYSTWLEETSQDPRPLLDLLRPCPSEWLEAYPVGPEVGHARNEGPELIARLT